MIVYFYTGCDISVICCRICDKERTASFVAVIDETGEFRFGVGDVDIHRIISAQHVCFDKIFIHF